MKNPQFEKDIVQVSKVFNKLNVVEENQELFLRGSLDIVDNDGKVWDTYHVEIKGSHDYPYAFPYLFETGDSFPKNADWHVYEDTLSCCITVKPNELLICKNGLHVLEYIKQFAIPYLANQTYRMREGYYLHGEYSHGFLGYLEFYQNKLKPQSLVELLKMFELIIGDFNPDRTAMCPFCPKTKFRKCHRSAFRELQSIKTQVENDSLEILKLLKNNPLLLLS